MSNRIFKNTVIYGLGNISQKGISFLLVFLYTHYLLPAEIGVINTLQVFSAIFLLFLSLGLERTIYRLYHDYPTEEGKRNFLGTISIGIFFISILFIVLFSFVGYHLKSIAGLAFYPFLILGMADAFTSVLTVTPKLVFQVKEKPVQFVLLLMGNAVLNLIFVFIALRAGHNSAEEVVFASVLASCAFLPFSLFATFKNINFVFIKEIFYKSLKYSLPLLPTLLSSWVINLSDRLFLKTYQGFAEVGYYSVAYKIGQMVQLFATAILMAYNPYFFSIANKKPLDEAKLNGMHNYNIIILLFLSFSIALLGKDIISIALNKNYLNVAYLVPLVILGYFFIQLTSLQNLSFYQTKKTVLLMNINVGMSIVNIALNYFLIPGYGMIGAAFSTIITQFILFIVTYYLSKKMYILRIEFFKLIPILIGMVTIITLSYQMDFSWMLFVVKLLVISMIFLLLFKDKIKAKLSR